jgi:hypothetical protein
MPALSTAAPRWRRPRRKPYRPPGYAKRTHHAAALAIRRLTLRHIPHFNWATAGITVTIRAMGGEVLIGAGLSAVFAFARWRFPAVPHKFADGGLIAGIALVFFGVVMPNVTLTTPAILLFVAGCLCFGGAAHLALRDGTRSVVAAREKPANTMGSVTNNSGIITQGQRGDNEINKLEFACGLFIGSTVIALAQNEKPPNSIGSITNNSGIITQGQIGNNTIGNPIRREANGIYQGDQKIGDAPPPQIDETRRVAVFPAFHLTNYPDQSRPLEYGDLLLSSEGTPQPRPNTYIGTLSIMIAGFQAKIIGHR